ncbi:MAG: SMI1/KNR4 family protein [Gammaproteobacteria bacterium]|nr:SMI1/KNR4 family protein [Gammaproteobacteria bacterium]MBU1554484.1 SMI1/KNR4 family protein [Gammaproteobacteria bacterium]MBU2070688.1 SMI1/KNR4 family protein [Gammaproteobacteria bacterium]MBU2184218.1 SMI1/KNR4 family protein [Gammaproteobacteria bacterium]MBU2206079.1 SMI1/KNR4 family protein [Gammaproteobacteria bacterium]
MEYSEVIENWKTFAEAVKAIGGDLRAFTVEEPATEKDILGLEERLGFSLPASLREVLVNFSRKVEFRWFFPDKYELEGELSAIFSGDRHWSLDWIYDFNESKNGWVERCFPNKDDPYDVVWHNKLAFHEVGNGDYLAIDLSSPGSEPVVYLSHDDGDGHGVELANNFKDFLCESSLIGCVGGEDWQQLPFIENGKKHIDGNCGNAIRLRKALGIKA